MNKQEKAAEIEALESALKSGPTAFILAPKGLTVNQVTALRRKIRATAGSYRVVKNRLALRAIKGSPLESLAAHFKGETAVAYSAADAAPLAKVIEDFSKDNQGLKIKAGLVDGRVVGLPEIRAIADMPPRPVLVARFLGVLMQPMTRLVRVLKEPHRGVLRAMDEIAKKKEAAPQEAVGPTT